MSEFFCDGFLILLGGHAADLTLAIYLDVQLYGLNSQSCQLSAHVQWTLHPD